MMAAIASSVRGRLAGTQLEREERGEREMDTDVLLSIPISTNKQKTGPH